MPLDPPTREEFLDALRVLAEQLGGELEEEALRILEESSERSP